MTNITMTTNTSGTLSHQLAVIARRQHMRHIDQLRRHAEAIDAFGAAVAAIPMSDEAAENWHMDVHGVELGMSPLYSLSRRVNAATSPKGLVNEINTIAACLGGRPVFRRQSEFVMATIELRNVGWVGLSILGADESMTILLCDHIYTR